MKDTLSPYPYLTLGTTILVDAFLCAKFQVEKSKVSFCDVPERNHGILVKNTVKMQYFGSNKLYARTFFKVFIGH